MDFVLAYSVSLFFLRTLLTAEQYQGARYIQQARKMIQSAAVATNAKITLVY